MWHDQKERISKEKPNLVIEKNDLLKGKEKNNNIMKIKQQKTNENSILYYYIKNKSKSITIATTRI